MSSESGLRTLLTLALLPLFAAACHDGPASPQLESSVAGLFQDATELDVGEVLTLTAQEAQAVVLSGGENGAEYVYIPFNASDVATARLALEVRGVNVAAQAGSPSAAAIPAPWATGPRENEAFHIALRQREIRELQPLIRRTGASLSAAPTPARVPTPIRLGDVLSLNANSEQACANPDLRQGRVVAVGERAIVVEDLANPAGGFSAEEFRNVAATFDTLIYPVDTRNFGELQFPGYIGPQERVIIFYTRVVNELTEPGSDSYVGGFFFARDIFPRQPEGEFEACPTSNEAPILYLLAPDPTGDAGAVRSRDFVLRVTLSTIAHELQHLINQSRRLFVTAGAESFEEVWLNEGLSHIAEELMFYHATGLSPRENIGIAALTASERILQLFFTYGVSNFGRYIEYLEEPDTTSLIGVDNLPTRGAAWAFLRYAADQEDGPDATFFRRLVDGKGTGVANLRDALPVDPIDLMQTWTVSVYTDDALPAVPFPRIYQQPSWNFRSVITGFKNAQGQALYSQFPLALSTLTEQEKMLDLRAGGAAFVRFGVPARQEATILTTSGGAVPGERLRISIVRIR